MFSGTRALRAIVHEASGVRKRCRSGSHPGCSGLARAPRIKSGLLGSNRAPRILSGRAGAGSAAGARPAQEYMRLPGPQPRRPAPDGHTTPADHRRPQEGRQRGAGRQPARIRHVICVCYRGDKGHSERASALGCLWGGRTGLPRRLRRGAGAAIATSRRANKGDGLGGGRRGTLPRRRRGDEGAALRSRAVPAGRSGGTTDARPHRLQQTRPVMLNRVYTARGTTTAAKTALDEERTASRMFAA